MVNYRFLNIVILAAFQLIILSKVTYADVNIDPTVVGKSDIPVWVVPLEADKVLEKNLDGATSGILYNLSDNQVRWLPDGYEFYYRLSYQIIDRSGLEEASRITRAFDPSDTAINFNFIKVTRADKTQERLAGTEFTLLRQENGLDKGIVDGTLTVLVELDDIRVGDTIDYAVSGKVTSQLWPGHFFDEVTLGWSVPIGTSRYRLIWPKDRQLYIKRYNGVPEAEITEIGANQIYNWAINNPEPVQNEVGTPHWHVRFPRLSLSSMGDWQTVQKWAIPYYKSEDKLPKETAQQVKDIKRKWKKKEDRLTEALRLVQDNIRYVGIEIGLGSHIPRPPAEVVRSGYGDCKDKSLLLTIILRELGIRAWPALTDMDAGPGLPDSLPSTIAFDHMIVKARVGEKIYWLDATKSYQGGRGRNLAPLFYGYALPIDGKAAGLEEIALDAPQEPTIQVEETYRFSDSEDLFLTLATKVTYLSDEADTRRLSFSSQSLDQINRNYLDYYQGSLKGLESLKPVLIEDDIDTNRLVVTAEFKLGRSMAEENKVSDGFDLKAYAVKGLFHQPNNMERETPLSLPIYINRSHVFKVVAPGKRPKGMEDVIKETQSMQFERTSESKADTLIIRYSLTSNIRSTSPENYSAAVSFGKTVADGSSLTFTLNQVKKSLAATFKIDEEEFSNVEDRFIEVFNLIGAKNNIKTIQLLDVLEADHPNPSRLRGLIQIIRGEILSDMGRKSGARKAYAEGLALYPDNSESYFKLTDLYNQNEEYTKAARTLILLAENLPEKVKSLRLRWLGSLKRNLVKNEQGEVFDDLAIALSKAGYKGNKNSGADWVYQIAVKALIGKNETETAKSLSVNINDSALLLELLIDRRYEAIWPVVEERSGKNLRKAIEADLLRTQKEYEAAPDDYKLLLWYMQSLRAAGQSQEAIKVAKPMLDEWSKVVATGKDAFWVANAYAYTLIDVGQFDKAMELMRKINSLGPEDFPNIINMSINHAMMLMENGSFEKAVSAAEAIDLDYASTYGKMFVWSVKSCSIFACCFMQA